MAYILFSSYPFDGFSQQEFLSAKIRLSIFLITGECVGLPAVVWAFYHCYKSGSRVSPFVITLLLFDLLVLLLNPYIVTKLLQDEKCWERSMMCWTLSSLWSTSIISGLHLQQVVALEGALALRHPPCSAPGFFLFCSTSVSIIICICLFIYFFFCELVSATPYVLFALPVLLAVISTSFIVSCRTPPQISDTPYRTRNPSFTTLAFVTLTLILYGIFSSMCVIMSIGWRFSLNLFVMGVSLMSLNVIIDPLLCVIIYRKCSELTEIHRKPTEIS